MIRRAALGVLLLIATACAADRDPDAESRRRAEAAADTGFAGVQSRGEQAMGVDQFTSSHVFEPLPDGGRISLERDTADSAGIAQIRTHMGQIAAAFKSGDFTLPGFVHAQAVPGTDVMAAKREAITYSVEELPRGGAVRLQTADRAAIRAIHEFLAFQRSDHHAAGTHD
jgi:hypothetical protein